MISFFIIAFCSVKKKGYVLKKFSEGANNLRYKHTGGCKRSVHAEEEAIRLLPPNNKKKNIKIQILIIRSTKIGEISMSKPCKNCLEKLCNIKGYKITEVYYTIKGGIVVKKLKDLLKEEKHLSRFFRK